MKMTTQLSLSYPAGALHSTIMQKKKKKHYILQRKILLMDELSTKLLHYPPVRSAGDEAQKYNNWLSW